MTWCEGYGESNLVLMAARSDIMLCGNHHKVDAAIVKGVPEGLLNYSLIPSHRNMYEHCANRLYLSCVRSQTALCCWLYLGEAACFVQQLATKQLFSLLAASAASASQPGEVKACFWSPFFMIFFLAGLFLTHCPAALLLQSLAHSFPSTCTADAPEALLVGETAVTATAAAVVSCFPDLPLMAGLLPLGAV